jgi:aerobic-type carbon monoxide dehydrogenase small subunit (CoxS/CutS family)
MSINFALNGRPTSVEAHPTTVLLDVLHHEQKI